MNKCFAYIRPKHGMSSHQQRSAIERYAQKHDLIITKWYEDAKVSALGPRPHFQRMLRNLATGSVSAVISDQQDRFTRRLSERAQIAQLAEKRGVQFHFVGDRPHKLRFARNNITQVYAFSVISNRPKRRSRST